MSSPALCLYSPVYLLNCICSNIVLMLCCIFFLFRLLPHPLHLLLSLSFISFCFHLLLYLCLEVSSGVCFFIPAQVAYTNGSNINRCYPICESRDRGRLDGILTADSKSGSRLAWALSPKWRAQICYISSEKMPRERCSTSKMWSNPPPRLFLSQTRSSFDLYRSA